MSLVIDRINAYYGNFHVLHDVSFTIERGELHALLGRNGAGKTTTLRTVFGLMDRWTGSVTRDGESLGGKSPHEINRSGLAYVPEYRGIFSDLTVRENLTIATRQESEWPAERILDLFPALKPLLDRKGRNLSGGEQQMLAIGRALISSPKYLLLDEPSQGLAPIIVENVIDTLHRLRGEQIGILLVEQNVEIALDIANQASIIEQGEIVFHGTAAETRDNKQMMDAYLSVG